MTMRGTEQSTSAKGSSFSFSTHTWRNAAGLLMALAAVVMVFLGFSGAGQAGAVPLADPSGNIGTVKIDGTPFEQFPPNNEPHVGCSLEINFYQFDRSGPAHYRFDVQAPTNDTPDKLLLENDVTLVNTAPSPGMDFNGTSGQIDLTQALINSGVSPQLNQGFHIKLTVTTPSPNGADTKFKVFWVAGCAVPTPTSTATSTPTNTPTRTPTNTPSNTPTITSS